jgi:hypothetical protein
MDIFSFEWLIGDSISSATYNEGSKSWTVSFKSGVSLNIECLWRLIEEGDICSTSEDHGHLFGRGKPFDGVAALKKMGQYKIDSVETVAGTGDLIIKFNKLFVWQILTTSSGYEGWNINHPNFGSVFTQGGQLHTYEKS